MDGFISYAHTDARMVGRLHRQLHPIREISLWTDLEIMAGDRWETAILAKLDSAKLILLCISPDFFWSRFIRTVELERAKLRHGRGECEVVPVILKPCLWQQQEFIRDLQAVPQWGKPIQSFKPQDPGLYDAAQLIQQKARRLAAGALP